jgi:Saxitoxin biosynthesis operon protein SxtJ
MLVAHLSGKDEEHWAKPLVWVTPRGGVAVLGAFASWEHRSTYILWASLAALFLLIALSMPRVLAPLRRAWIPLGQLMGRVMHPLILGIVYALVIIPAGGLMRLFRRDPLARRKVPGVASYWVARTEGTTDARSLKEQF